MQDFLKRTWAEIDLNAAAANFGAIRKQVRPGCRVLATVKADAYGHGAPEMAREFERDGADYFSVSNLEEALQLRRAGIRRPILILGYTPAAAAGTLIADRITQTVFSEPYAAALSRAAEQAGGRVKVHLSVDTGMSRIGFVLQDPSDEAACAAGMVRAASQPGLETEGVFTHFAVSDEPGNPFTRVQFNRFMRAISLCGEQGIHFSIRHCCNSAGLLGCPDMQLDMVRPGIILYGLTPAQGLPMPICLQPVMQLKTVLFQKKTVRAGTPVSYGMTYRAPGERVLGTLPVGYADGFARRLAGRGSVLLGGRRAPIVGRVCMDQCMADITDVPDAAEGCEVTLIGRDGAECISADEFAAWNDTISYEVVCLVSKRVPRVFFRDGRRTDVLDYILPRQRVGGAI